jgi:hypothetical protein
MSIRVNVIGVGPVEFPDGTSQEEMERALKQLPGAKPEAPGALETGAREFATGIAPGAAAAAAFVPGMAAGAPFAEFAGPAAPLVPLVTGAGASLLAGGAVELGQQKLLEKYAPGFLEQTAAGAAAHPVAAGAGRVASAAPSFAFAPGQTIEGALAIPSILRGTAIASQKKAAASLAAQLGAQAGITAAQTGLAEHRLTTAPELLESAAIAGLYGHPRFSLPIPKTLEKGLIDYATQKRKREESRQREHPGTQAQRVPPETGGGNRPAPAAGLEKETQISLKVGDRIPKEIRDENGVADVSPGAQPHIDSALNSLPTGSQVRDRIDRLWEKLSDGTWFMPKLAEGMKVDPDLDLNHQSILAGGKVERVGKPPAAFKEPTIPQITGSDQTGWTLRMAGREEAGFRTKEEATNAAMSVMAGERQLTGAAEPTPEPEPTAAPAEPDLVEQMERAAIDEGEKIGVPIKPVDTLTGEEDVPFAKKGEHGIYLMATGTGAELHRGEFAKQIAYWRAQGFSSDQIRELVISAVNEERIHNDISANTTQPEVEGYWNDLTQLEKDLETYIYTGSTKPGKPDTPYRMGQEAIRRRMQKAMRLPVREFLETVGREHWRLRGLDLLGDMVRRTRELVGTKASTRQRALFERALGNINAAKVALSGVGPGAQRREGRDLPEGASDDEFYEVRDSIDERGIYIDGKEVRHDEVGWEGWDVHHVAAGILLYGRERERAIIELLNNNPHTQHLYRHLIEIFKSLEGKKVELGPVDKPLPPPDMEGPTQLRFPFAKRRKLTEEGGLEDIPYRFQNAPSPQTWGDTGIEASTARFSYLNSNKPLPMFDEFRETLSTFAAGSGKWSHIRSVLESLATMPEKSWDQSVFGGKPFASALRAYFQSVHGTEDSREALIQRKLDHEIEIVQNLRAEKPDEFGGALNKTSIGIHERLVQALRDLLRKEGGQQMGPAARRRDPYEPEQQKMFPDITAKGIPGAPETPPEQRPVETGRPPAGQLETAAAHIFSGFMPPLEARQGGVVGPPIREPAEPTFQSFRKWADTHGWSGVAQGPLFDIWLDTVNKTIENAPGPKLNEMVEKLGLEHKVYPWKRVPSKVSPALLAKFKEEGADVRGGATQYTKVEIPDFQQIPPDPNRLPLSIEAAIRQRVLESEMFPETATEEDIQKAQDAAVDKARKEVMALIPPERVKELVEQRKGVIRGQRLRSKALSAIYQKVIEEGMPTITDLTPTDITTDDIAWDNPNAKNFGAYHTITPDERKSPDKLKAIFSEEARRKDWPVSHTRKLAVMLNKRSGEVALVSAYVHGRRGLMVTEPSGATGKRGKPNVPMQSAINRGWDPILAILRKDPLKDFYKGFKDIAEYNRYLGREAAELDRTSVEDFVGSRAEDALPDVPEDSTQAWKEQAMAVEPTEHDLVRLMEERERPTEGFAGPMPSEVVGEEFRPGSAVVRGEGGTMIGPEADIARMGRGDRFESSPLSTREALALHNWLNDPDEWSGTSPIKPVIESTTTKPEMREALQRLYDLAANNKLKPRQWNAIIALRKMAIEQHRRDLLEFRDMRRDLMREMKGATKEQLRAALEALNANRPTPESSMVTALDRLYEINQISESQADYLSHAMGEFARPIPEAKGPAAVPGAPTQAAPGATGPVFQEPTLVAPGTLTGAGLYKGPHGEKNPLPPSKWAGETEPTGPPVADAAQWIAARAARLFKYEPTIYPPKGKDFGPGASIRQRAKEEWEGIINYARKAVSVPYNRQQTNHDILAAADGADRQLDLYSNTWSNEIRAASVKPSEKKLTLKEKFLGGAMFTKEALMVRRAAKASIAAEQVANEEDWQEVVRKWAQAKRDWEPVQEEARRRHQKVPPMPPELRPVKKVIGPDDVRPDHFDKLIQQVENGIEKAEMQLKSPTYEQRRIARMWREAGFKLLEEVKYAQEHFKDPEMRNTVQTFREVMAQHLDNMNAYGMNVQGRDYYVPGRYEGEVWNDDTLTWSDMRILGRQYRLPKSFTSYYHAISEGPYMPLNPDIADLAKHSLASGGRVMARETWAEGLKNIIDPVSKKPVAIEPAWGLNKPVEMSPESFAAFSEELRKAMRPGQAVPPELLMSLLKEAGVTKKPWGFTVPKGKEDYTLIPMPNGKPLVVREGYRSVVETAIARSAIRDIPALRTALTASQMLKHGLILIIDTFHPGRLAQYAVALSGKNILGIDKPGFGGRGLSALTWNFESLDEAVRVGAITQKQADWARAPIRIYDRGSIKQVTRHELLRMLLRRGLNASQTADDLYYNSIQRIPFIGKQWNELLAPMNKWIFERITPGIIAESAVANLERINAKNKQLSLDTQIREVVRDTNIFYGNMGRNGIFKHPTARDLAQIVLLAPLWQNGLIAKEMRTLSRATGLSYALGRRGLGADVYFGPLTRGIVRGLGAYFVLTQMINLASRGKWTFQNDEPDHKMDAWLPMGGEQGLWLSPLSVFAEISHDIIRLAETKPTTWDAITQIGRNKLGPMGRLMGILISGKSPTGEKFTSTGATLGAAAKELTPAPISLGTFAKTALPSVFGKPRPGAWQRQALASVGVKTQPGTRAETDIRRLAKKFVTDNNLSYEPLAFEPTDLPSYAKLRGALRNDDEKSAARILKELRQHRNDAQILKAMKLEAQRPFTGSRVNENLFLYSLSNRELEAYHKANIERQELLQRFYDFFTKQPWVRQP